VPSHPVLHHATDNVLCAAEAIALLRLAEFESELAVPWCSPGDEPPAIRPLDAQEAHGGCLLDRRLT